MQTTPRIRPTPITVGGQTFTYDQPTIARMARDGLTSVEYAVLALVAAEHKLTVDELLHLALEGEAPQ